MLAVADFLIRLAQASQRFPEEFGQPPLLLEKSILVVAGQKVTAIEADRLRKMTDPHLWVFALACGTNGLLEGSDIRLHPFRIDLDVRAGSEQQAVFLERGFFQLTAEIVQGVAEPAAGGFRLFFGPEDFGQFLPVVRAVLVQGEIGEQRPHLLGRNLDRRLVGRADAKTSEHFDAQKGL